MNSIIKVCRTCKQEKPINNFYDTLGRRDGKSSDCKECVKAVHKKNYKAKDRRDTRSGRQTENRVIEQLCSIGIYSVSGKASGYKWCDVVAWGCVTIEVKTAPLSDRQFQFSFTYTQVKRGIQAKIIMLVCDYGGYQTFHLFPSSHPVFYQNGILKHGVTYTPHTPSPKLNRVGVSLNDKVMTEFQDNWELIEGYRLKWFER